MTNPSTLDAVEIHGITRSAFIVRGALAAGSVYGAATVGPFVKQAIAQQSMGDVEILNFALTLENLEAEFYRRAIEDARLSGDAQSLAEEIGANEQEHVDTLTQTITDLGGTPEKAPKVKFPLRNQSGFLELAVTLEDTGVSAYNGAAPQIESKEVLAAAGSIVQVEARHAAAVRLVADQQPAPDAFDPVLSMDEVLEAVQPFVRP
jgi:rubrerythrin